MYERVEEGMLKWFGHINTMSEDRLSKRYLCEKQREHGERGYLGGGRRME